MVAIDHEGLWEGWHVEELLGSGSYGSVYRISRENLGHVSQAAAKLINVPGDPAEMDHLRSMGMDDAEISAYLEGVARGVLDEVSVMESLQGSGNVVAIEDYRLVERESGEGWSIWIRMELLEGLPSYISRRGRLAPEEVVDLGIDLCRALERCHAIGVVHRDVKPENVFRGRFGDFKLGDFGISRSLESTVRTDYSRKGTPMYTAPEIARGDGCDERADVYSLGIMLYRLLNDMRYPLTPTAPSPVGPDDLREALRRRHAGEALPSPCDADEALAAIVLKACEGDPGKRYQAAAELRGELETWQDGTSGGGDGGRMRRGVIFAVAATMVALAVVAAAAVVVDKGRSDDTSGTNAQADAAMSMEASAAEDGSNTLEAALARGDKSVGVGEQDETLRRRFGGDYPDVGVSTNVTGNLIDTTISLGRELTPLEEYSFQVWLRDGDMSQEVGQSLLELERASGVEGIRHRYTVFDSSNAVIAQATFAGSGVVQFEGMDLRVTLEDALNDPSIGDEVVESIRSAYESTAPDWKVLIDAQGNELKILMRSDSVAADLDASAAEANAYGDEQVQRMSQMAALLEDTFHIDGVTIRLTLCDSQDSTIVSVAYGDNGIVDD